jgi:hypothetical protein
MDQDKKAFNEVRALLGRLDRSIDEARSKRLGPSVGSVEHDEVAQENEAARVDLDQEIGGSSAPAPMTELQRKSASFGRAKPLSRGDDTPQWRATGTDDLIG